MHGEAPTGTEERSVELAEFPARTQYAQDSHASESPAPTAETAQKWIDGELPSEDAPVADETDGASHTERVAILRTTKVESTENSIGWFEAYMHLIKGNFGPGCLALPIAFAHVGPAQGALMLLVIGCQGTFSMVLLVILKHRLNSTRVATYADLGEAALGSYGRGLTEGLVLALQLGVCCVFISLVATNLVSIMQGTLPGTVAALLVYLVCLALSMIPDMKYLAPLSTVANALMLTACITAVVAACNEISRGEHTEVHSSAPRQVFLALGALFYAYEGITLVLPLEIAFRPSPHPTPGRHPKHAFVVILIAANVSLVLMFGLVGVSCSIAFPDISTGSITAFLSELDPSNDFYTAVNVFVSVAVALTFPLQLQPAVGVLERALYSAMKPVQHSSSTEDVLEQRAKSSTRRKCASFVLIRTAATTFCAVVVICLPQLDLLISLLGGMCQAVMAGTPFVFASRFQIMGTVKFPRVVAALTVLCALFCAMCAVIGTADAVKQLVHSLGASVALTPKR